MTSKYYCGVSFGVPGIIRHRGSRPFIGWLEESSSLGPWIPYDYLCYSFFLRDLSWLNLVDWLQNQCLCLFYKILHGALDIPSGNVAIKYTPGVSHRITLANVQQQTRTYSWSTAVHVPRDTSHQRTLAGVCHEQRLMLERVSRQWGTGRRGERK